MVDNERDITIALQVGLALSFEPYERLKKIDMKACFLTAREMYHKEFGKAEHCTLNKDLFLKLIPIDDLITEVNKRID